MKGRYKRQAQIPTSKTSVEERTYFEHRELSQSEATQISLEGMMLKLKLQYFGVSPHVKSLLKFMLIESGTVCNHFILCCPLLLLPSIFLSIRVFPNESAGQQVANILQMRKVNSYC